MRNEELIESFRWLIDGARPHCDEVRFDLLDYGYSLQIAFLWKVDGKLTGQCVWAQLVDRPDLHGGEAGPTINLNYIIAAKGWTREGFLADLIAKRPKELRVVG